MSLQTILQIFQILAMIITVVWTIGKINTTTALLEQAVNNLSGTIIELKSTIKEVQKKLSDHGERLASLER